VGQRPSTVVRNGDHRLSLIAIRDKLAEELDEAFGRDSAVIAKQLAEVIREIESLPGKEASAVDDLAARRARRLADAAGQ
jgi:hypothetical protein